MTEAHIGRLLAASLHQAIGDLLPQRLEFYENWLHSEGLRDGTIGLAPITAVVGFLRTEGGAYGDVVARAGELSSDWTIASLPPFRLRMLRWLPRRLRVRAALRVADEIARSVSRDTRLSRRVRGGSARVQVSSSLFCSARAAQPLPLCGFYLALVVRTCHHLGVTASARSESCRAIDGSPCVIVVDLSRTESVPPPALAA
jgi:hypothetical protein